MNTDELIGTLEQSLRQFQSAKARLAERLEKVKIEISAREREAAALTDEIAALENSAAKTEKAIEGLIGSALGNRKS